jgi:hypothetical protein
MIQITLFCKENSKKKEGETYLDKTFPAAAAVAWILNLLGKDKEEEDCPFPIHQRLTMGFTDSYAPKYKADDGIAPKVAGITPQYARPTCQP